MSIEAGSTGPNGMGYSAGAVQAAEQAATPSVSPAKSSGGSRFGESLAHTTPLSVHAGSFSKDIHHSDFRVTEFTKHASAKPETSASHKSLLAERQNLENIFKSSAPLDVSRTSYTHDKPVEKFQTEKFMTVWKAPSVEHVKPSVHSNFKVESSKPDSPKNTRFDQLSNTQQSTLNHSFISKDKAQPLFNHETTILWQAKPDEKPETLVQNTGKDTGSKSSSREETIKTFPTMTSTLAPTEVKNTGVTPPKEKHVNTTRNTDRFASRVHVSPLQPSETRYHTYSKAEQQKDSQSKTDVIKSTNKVEVSDVTTIQKPEISIPLVEHQEVQKTLQKAKPQQQEKIVSVQPEYKGQKVELDTQTKALMKSYKMGKQSTPQIEHKKTESAYAHTSLKPETTFRAKATEQQKEAIVKTFIQAANVIELMEETGVQTETAQEKILKIVHEVLQKQGLQTATDEVIKLEIPDEKTEEHSMTYFNRDAPTNAVRQKLAISAAAHVQDEHGKIDGAHIAQILPGGNVENVKSELVRDTSITDGSMEEFKEEIAQIQADSLIDMKDKIEETTQAKPAVKKSQEVEDPVSVQDVQRVLRGQIAT